MKVSLSWMRLSVFFITNTTKNGATSTIVVFYWSGSRLYLCGQRMWSVGVLHTLLPVSCSLNASKLSGGAAEMHRTALWNLQKGSELQSWKKLRKDDSSEMEVTERRVIKPGGCGGGGGVGERGEESVNSWGGVSCEAPLRGQLSFCIALKSRAASLESPVHQWWCYHLELQ